MTEEYRVVVWQGDQVVGRVRYNNILDHWNGSEWSVGSVGHHMGITKLANGKYVLIYGTQWEYEKDWAEVVTDTAALQAILQANKVELLARKKFKRLAAMYKDLEQEEEEAEDIEDARP